MARGDVNVTVKVMDAELLALSIKLALDVIERGHLVTCPLIGTSAYLGGCAAELCNCPMELARKLVDSAEDIEKRAR